MKRTFKKLLALCLVMVLALAMTLPALAATGISVALTKRVLVPVGMTPPTTSYSFTFTPGTVDNSATPVSPNLDYNSLGNNTVSISYTGGETKGGTLINGYEHYDLSIASLFKDTVFPHAGTFNYSVTEVETGTLSIGGGTLTYSQAIYTVKVNVKNDGSGGLEVASAAIIMTQKDDGTPIPSGSQVKTPDLLFTNTFDSDNTFTVSKAVTGNFADLTKDFTYTINFQNYAPTTINALHTDANGVTTPKTLNTTAGTFTLKNGESLTFSSLTTTVTYDLIESAALGYEASVTVNGSETETGAVGDAVEIGTNAASINNAIWLST